jgi:aspartyl-tRNA(Asn)/glutamyl-tRNA(Gln) amidotransferase subunit B
MSWETVIGLEIHTQLATNSKIFSGAATAYGAQANTQACDIDLGLPGVLPVINESVVRMAISFGLAVNAEITGRSVFARKNYFYPDLPKGYQISQFEDPIVGPGSLTVRLDSGETITVGITRAHLEEDAGKSLHEDFHGLTGIDLNRAGTPLLEIVSEPDMHTAEQAVAYARAIHALVCYLGISDGNMQEGSFRCDANVSIRKLGDPKLGTRAELKNINSFRFLERGINFEIQRQIELLESGGRVVQETRTYDSERDETRSMREKEESNDYRYFPDPDLLPLLVEPAFIAKIKSELPELPEAKRLRFLEEYGLNEAEAQYLTGSRELAEYFEALTRQTDGESKLAANWITSELAGALNSDGLGIEESRLSPEQLSGLLARIVDKTISGKIAKDVFNAMWAGEGEADQIISERGLQQITDSGELEALVDEVIEQNLSQVEQYLSGKEKVLGFFVGQIMKKSGGKANPGLVNKLLRIKLEQRR